MLSWHIHVNAFYTKSRVERVRGGEEGGQWRGRERKRGNGRKRRRQ